MERLTEYTRYHGGMLPALRNCNRYSAIERLATIEDILGDDYGLDRLRELVEADREGRCIVIPDFVYKIGETKGVIKIPYKSWMGRFMGVKFFRTEKEAAEAALKGEQDG